MGPVSRALEGGLDAHGPARGGPVRLRAGDFGDPPGGVPLLLHQGPGDPGLISMGREELESLIQEQGQAELTCQFCDQIYRYSKEDLEEILANM